MSLINQNSGSGYSTDEDQRINALKFINDFYKVGSIASLNGVDYRLSGVLGYGSNGVVFKAKQESIKRDRAIKIYFGDLLHENFERFKQEIGIAANVSDVSSYTVKPYSCGDVKFSNGLTAPGVVLEYVPGYSLKDVIRLTAGKMNLDEIFVFMDQTLSSLDRLHGQSIIHRDMKPQNILIDNRRTIVKISDFGTARDQNLESQLTMDNKLVGTRPYLSRYFNTERTIHKRDIFEDDRGKYAISYPGMFSELFKSKGRKVYLNNLVKGKDSDTYSYIHVGPELDLGPLVSIILYEMLTGDNPFIGGGANRYNVELFAKKKYGGFAFNDLNDKTQAHLKHMTYKGVDPFIENTYHTAGEIRDDLVYALKLEGKKPKTGSDGKKYINNVTTNRMNEGCKDLAARLSAGSNESLFNEANIPDLLLLEKMDRPEAKAVLEEAANLNNMNVDNFNFFKEYWLEASTLDQESKSKETFDEVMEWGKKHELA